MQNLIEKALNDAFIILEKQVPQTKKKRRSVYVQDIKPIELISFMKSNNIPADADFDKDDDDDLLLSWLVSVPTTEQEKTEYRNYRFHDIAWANVYKILVTNGYKRIAGKDIGRISYKNRKNFISSIIMFDNKTIYEMYIDKDLDKLMEYYSMYFQKEL